MTATFNNSDRLPPARILRRTFVVGKKDISGFAANFVAKVIATQITDRIGQQTGVLNQMVEDEAKASAKELSRDILNGRLRIQADSREHAAWKRRTGRSDHPLVSTKQYARSIVAVEERPGLHRVTVKSGKHRDSGLPLARLSRILEEGTLDGIPARPHFAKAARKAKQRLTARLARYQTECAKAQAVNKNRKQRLRP